MLWFYQLKPQTENYNYHSVGVGLSDINIQTNYISEYSNVF